MALKFKIGLALGGGAARGLAHLGVLRVLEREGIPIDLIAGTSMGSLVGAMYAGQPRIEKLIQRAQEFFGSPEFVNSKIHYLKRGEEEQGFFESVGSSIRRTWMLGSTVTRTAFLEAEDLYDLLRRFVDDRDIRSLQIPLAIIVCDLLAGEEVVLKRGPLIDAIAASSAVPGAFPPIKIGERECIDGGVVHMVPGSVARDMGADFVIAVNVSHELLKPPELKRALEIFFRTQEITKQTLINHQLNEADVVITPPVGEIHWADFTAAEKIIEIGQETAEKAMPEIRQALGKQKRWRPFRKFKRKKGLAKT